MRSRDNWYSHLQMGAEARGICLRNFNYCSLGLISNKLEIQTNLEIDFEEQ